MPHTAQPSVLNLPDGVTPTLIETGAEQARRETAARVESGGVLHIGAVAEAALLNRVTRVRRALDAGQEVSDPDLIQYAADCTVLMARAYQSFQRTLLPYARELACEWMDRRDEARRRLSPAFKAAREAAIQQAISEGCYFTDQGDAARARLAGGHGQ